MWVFSLQGHYIGYKLSLVVAYPSMKPLWFLLHPGFPSDAKLYDIILGELRQRRLARNGDLVVFDKGYFSYANYVKGVARYKIVPGIFPKINTPREKILGQLAYTLASYEKRGIAQRPALYRHQKSGLRRFLEKWKR